MIAITRRVVRNRKEMRKLFSQREGHKPVRSTLPVNFVEAGLRSRLWDLVTLSYWSQVYGADLRQRDNPGMKFS